MAVVSMIGVADMGDVDKVGAVGSEVDNRESVEVTVIATGEEAILLLGVFSLISLLADSIDV